MTCVLGAILAVGAFLSPTYGSFDGIKNYAIYIGENEAIVAVAPDAFSSYAEKRAHLSSAAKLFAEKIGKRVLLTEDLVCYSAIRRIEKKGRGSDVRLLEKRVRKIRASCYSFDNTP